MSSDLKSIENLLKDLLILEMGKAGFSNPEIKDVLGKADNNKLAKILGPLRKNRGKKAA